MRRVASLLAAVLTVGCAAGGFTVHSTRSVASVGSTGFALLSSDPVVEIRGTPPGGASPEAVAAAMRMPGGFVQRPFRLAPADGLGTRLVLIFGARAVNDGTVCAPAGQGGGAPARLAAAAALCVGSRPAASGVLVSDAASPDDPAFRAAIQGLIQGMNQANDQPRRRLGSAD